MEMCAEGVTGIVTNVTGKIGFIWSPHVDDAIFIPPNLLDPELKAGNWVVFSAEYYLDKKNDRRIRVTEYEVLANDCLPVRLRGKELLVRLFLCSILQIFSICHRIFVSKQEKHSFNNEIIV